MSIRIIRKLYSTTFVNYCLIYSIFPISFISWRKLKWNTADYNPINIATNFTLKLPLKYVHIKINCHEQYFQPCNNPAWQNVKTHVKSLLAVSCRSGLYQLFLISKYNVHG